MPVTQTNSVVVARPAHDKQLAWRDGLTGETEGYGRVNVVRVTTTETRRGNDFAIGALLESHKEEEVLLSLNSEEAALLTRSLVTALAESLAVHAGVRL